ncbi:MAG: hypothetical protein FWG48_00140 [Oscillospiraceae bacterium]|jgi:hypothetical protein|nr:hypothetical protein [Oscillospiraceae bacterium]
MSEKKNMLEQKDKFRWRDNPPTNVTKEGMEAAFACAGDSEANKCDCWHTGCVYYDNCKACIVFHMCLDQFPTCQREKLEEWGVDYIGKTTGKSGS